MPHVYIPSASPKRQNPALLQESDQIAQESPQGVLREVGCLTVAAVAVAGDSSGRRSSVRSTVGMVIAILSQCEATTITSS